MDWMIPVYALACLGGIVLLVFVALGAVMAYVMVIDMSNDLKAEKRKALAKKKGVKIGFGGFDPIEEVS
jgi:hypothetical protein